MITRKLYKVFSNMQCNFIQELSFLCLFVVMLCLYFFIISHNIVAVHGVKFENYLCIFRSDMCSFNRSDIFPARCKWKIYISFPRRQGIYNIDNQMVIILFLT
jgi:hypothetical protein